MMACEYCDGGKCIVIDSEYGWAGIKKPSLLHFTVYDADTGTWRHSENGISFCPMCGERLGDTNE